MHNAPPAGGVTGAVYRVLERIVARSAGSVLCVSADLEERMRAAGARRVGRALVPAFASTAGVSAEAPAAAGPAALSLPGDPAPGRPLVLAAGRLAAQKGFAPCWRRRPGGGTSAPNPSWSSRAKGRSPVT